MRLSEWDTNLAEDVIRNRDAKERRNGRFIKYPLKKYCDFKSEMLR